MTPLRITVALCLLFVVVVVGLFVYSVTRPQVLSDDQLGEIGVFVWPAPRSIEPFHLRTAEGEPFTLDDLRGHWSFIYFGFTNCPDLCPTALSELAAAQRRLSAEHPEAAGDFQAVMVTVDPERDDAETLGRYVRAFSPTFIGVRGDRASVAALAEQVNVDFSKVPAEDGGYDVEHTPNIVVVDPRGDYHAFAKLPHEADTIVAAFLSLRERWR